jgi:hypothetical protein
VPGSWPGLLDGTSAVAPVPAGVACVQRQQSPSLTASPQTKLRRVVGALWVVPITRACAINLTSPTSAIPATHPDLHTPAGACRGVFSRRVSRLPAPWHCAAARVLRGRGLHLPGLPLCRPVSTTRGDGGCSWLGAIGCCGRQGRLDDAGREGGYRGAFCCCGGRTGANPAWPLPQQPAVG